MRTEVTMGCLGSVIVISNFLSKFDVTRHILLIVDNDDYDELRKVKDKNSKEQLLGKDRLKGMVQVQNHLVMRRLEVTSKGESGTTIQNDPKLNDKGRVAWCIDKREDSTSRRWDR